MVSAISVLQKYAKTIAFTQELCNTMLNKDVSVLWK